ncbi:MAG: tetratricopeptide repeat protein [Burkholderiales bacterium]|nr:tetratricopeptide repeat protein [Burkholderiales bacterium]
MSRHRLAPARNTRAAQPLHHWVLASALACGAVIAPLSVVAQTSAPVAAPTSAADRVQWLWLQIGGGPEKALLADRLQAWQAEAQADPAYWAAYAVALLQLQRVDESLLWYGKQVAANPQDHPWQVSYAEVLAQAGRPDEAQRIRSNALPHLKSAMEGIDKMPRAQAKALLLAYASAQRGLEGDSAGDQALKDLLARGYTDVDVYEKLVASSLAQEKFAEARDWLARAGDHQHTLPAYQTLAVALGLNDRPMLAKVVQERAPELSVPDRITALRRLGRKREALDLVEAQLPDAQSPLRELLLQHQAELQLALSRRVELKASQRNLGDLDITQTGGSFSLPLDSVRVTADLAHSRFRTDPGGLNLQGIRNETEVAFIADYALGVSPVRMTLGTNQRSDTSLTFGRLEYARSLARQLQLRLDAWVNRVTEESSALRMIGAKDRLAAGLSANLTPASYARIEYALQNFHTRKGAPLGHGDRVEGEVGGTVYSGMPVWRVRASGSAERNRLVDDLPPGLTGGVLSPFQTIDSVLARRFRTFGVGSTLQLGGPDGPQRRLRGSLDAWVGKQWPANELVYTARLVVAIPVTRVSDIRLEASYGDVKSIFQAQATRSATVSYRHDF